MLASTKVGGYKFNRLIIRLRRKGHVHYPLYEVVLMRKKSRNQAMILERLGFFNPHLESNVFIIDSSRFAF